jgi:hypothetical protein
LRNGGRHEGVGGVGDSSGPWEWEAFDDLDDVFVEVSSDELIDLVDDQEPNAVPAQPPSARSAREQLANLGRRSDDNGRSKHPLLFDPSPRSRLGRDRTGAERRADTER